MKIGVAGPVSLRLLAHCVDRGELLPAGYEFAPMAGWVEGLMRRGHSVELFTLSPGLLGSVSFVGERLNIHIAPYRPGGRARDFFSMEVQGLLALMRKCAVDVLHAHWTYEFALAALQAGGPIVVTAHDAPWEILRLHPGPYRCVRLIMALRVARMAPVMTAVSPHIARHFRRYMLRTAPIAVVPNGLPRLVSSHPARSRRAETSHQPTYATSMMGWGKLKNAAALLRAFRVVRTRIPGSRLMMFGSAYGPNEAAETFARAHGLTEGVQFVGKLPYPELIARLSAEADVLVHPALEESFGMAIVEAMSLGLPVIAGRASGAVPYVTDEGRAASLVDVRRPESIAEAMVELAGNVERWNQLSLRGRAFALARFSETSQLDGYEQAYEFALRARDQGSVAGRG